MMKRSVVMFSLVSAVLALFLYGFLANPAKAPIETPHADDQLEMIAEKMLKIWNDGDLSLVEDTFAPYYVRHEVELGENLVGIEALKGQIADIRAAYPDLLLMVDDQVLCGNKIVRRWRLSGTNKGPLANMPATGKGIAISGATITRIHNGRVAEDWVYYNRVEVFRQLGYTIEPPSMTDKN